MTLPRNDTEQPLPADTPGKQEHDIADAIDPTADLIDLLICETEGDISDGMLDGVIEVFGHLLDGL
jgi:hypothetical protein